MKLRTLSLPDTGSPIHTYYVHKKFGCIKIEKSATENTQDIELVQKIPITNHDSSKSVKILDVLVLNAPKNEQRSLKIPHRKTKVVKIAPYPSYNSYNSPPSSTKALEAFSSANTITKSVQQTIVHPSIGATAANLTPTSTAATTYSIQRTSPLSYVIQAAPPAPPAPPAPVQTSNVFMTPNSCSGDYFQPLSTAYTDGFGSQLLAGALSFTSAPAIVKQPLQQFEPMFYTRLLQLQLHAKAKKSNFPGRMQLFTEMQSIPS